MLLGAYLKLISFRRENLAAYNILATKNIMEDQIWAFLEP